MPRLKQAQGKSGPGSDGDGENLFVHSMPGHYIRRVQQVAVRLFSEDIPDDITPVQFAALSALADRPGLGQAALAQLIGYDRATIGGVIDRLETKGLAQRRPDPNDRRSNILTLTAGGREIVSRTRPKVLAVQDKLLAPLSDAEREEFSQMCQKIISAYGG